MKKILDNCTFKAYSSNIAATFVELPPFSRHREEYFDDESYHRLQLALLQFPEMGDRIIGSGGLRKLRLADPRRGKGKRGGLRVIYFWWPEGAQFWLFTVYDKDEMNDLSFHERRLLAAMLKEAIKQRRP